MRRLTRLAFVTTLAAATALAVSKGGALFVRTHDAKLLEAPDFKAKTVATLPLGARVTWKGAAAQNRQLHEVEWLDASKQPVKGYMFQAALGPTAPSPEFLTTGGAAIDAKAFKSSGAATKALGEGALGYASSKNLEEQARRLLAVEAINASITQAKSDERAARLGLAQREPLPEPPPPAPPVKKGKKGKKK
ncbi:MAG: hypothetical protein JNJ54_36500 [Myxococcaceae bacterium]|nr:hypothetical protein [Myxococcaceae bacterium]